jgi:hypothetical protein
MSSPLPGQYTLWPTLMMMMMMFNLKMLQQGCHKIELYTKTQSNQRHKRVNIQIMKDTDITEQQ